MVIIFYIILFCIFTATSVIFMGARDIVGVPWTWSHAMNVIVHWKFIAGILCAFAARIIFLMINSAVYAMPQFTHSATTVTFLATTMSIFVVVFANYYFLDERMTTQQIIGGMIIVVGVLLLFRGG